MSHTAPPTHTRRPWTMGDVRRLLALHDQGLSRQEIAARLDRHPASVYRYLHRYGCIEPRRYLTPQIAGQLRQWSRAGICTEEMARRLERHSRTVWRWLRRLDLVAVDGRKQLPPRGEECRQNMAHAQLDRARRICTELGWPQVFRILHARILCALTAGARTRQEVCDALGVKIQPHSRDCSIRKNLRQMEALRLVESQREGRAAKTFCVAGWLAARRETA